VGTVVALALVAMTGLVAGGCGGTPPSHVSAPASVDPTGGPTAWIIPAVFLQVARIVAPMPVYAPRALPEGVSFADDWWPVLDLTRKADYQGPTTPNPCVIGGEHDAAEVQVLFYARPGWLVVIENHRADLGDVRGERVGTIEGHNANLYHVNGGIVVRWSDGGRWYGVFGRDVPASLVIDVALSMVLVGDQTCE
jgi:hypothetical protein